MEGDDVSNLFVKLKKACRNFSEDSPKKLDLSAVLPQLEGKVYGRICNSPRKDVPPDALSSSSSRKMVFAFGHDGLSLILQQSSAYEALVKLGFLKEFLEYDVNVMKYGSWLVIFLPCLHQQPFSVYPATWNGVLQTVREHYPLLLSDFVAHFQELQEKNYEEFEREAGFRFIESLNNFKSGRRDGPPYYSYKYTCSLPKPLSSWQLRAFLYCELRLLELFNGTGHTSIEGRSNEVGPTEYLCPVVPLSGFSSDSMEIVQLNVVIPP